MPYTLIKPDRRIRKTAQNPLFFSRRVNEKRKRDATTGLN
jgi:rRNA processing protein Gar1